MRMVIIGGSAGLGFATAQRALSSNVELVIGGRSEERLQQAKKALGGSVTTFSVDVRDEASVEAFFKTVGPFDHLVTPGNSSHPGTFKSTEEARASFDSKYWGQYFAAKHGHPFIRDGGSIVLFSGALGTRPTQDCGIMVSINGAVEALARALAMDLAPHVRVNAIAPGAIESPRLAELMESNPAVGVSNDQAVPRLGSPDEVAQGVLFLCTNGYMSGSVLHVDGGYTLR
ncbi:MAG: SDR family oxidoreductase [Chlamydiia bacterium]